MPTIPWIKTGDHDGEAVVMASRLEVKSLRHVPRFFLKSISVWRQALRSPGALGVSLRADLTKRTFWTVSAWSDKKAVYAYAAAEPHKTTMRKLRGVMKESTFVFWQADAGTLPIDWTEIERRITAERDAELSR
ncbi:hypothetical protein ACIBH1_02080 [Nonomuraea sp. NPDC050663]|uniref:hypothetical protein n=1 Tax=Nonomuraea sp. NPDC050663 TaxID=3364370 RepID=UPI0037A31173